MKWDAMSSSAGTARGGIFTRATRRRARSAPTSLGKRRKKSVDPIKMS
jgi:hypothetical protein